MCQRADESYAKAWQHLTSVIQYRCVLEKSASGAVWLTWIEPWDETQSVLWRFCFVPS